jgi:hypothetical protein
VIARLRARGHVPAALQHVDRPEAIGLACVLALVAAIGWVGTPFVLAVAVAFELAAGGLGGVAIMGPARPALGLARYTTLALAGVAATLGGRLIPGNVQLLFAPLVAVLLWVVLWIEMRGRLEESERWMLDLALSGILFATAAGVNGVFPADTWPPPMGIVVLVGLVLGLRAAEGRGRFGVQGVGQALLHALAVGQALAATALLSLPGLVGQAVVAIVFYAWGGAADALDDGASSRSVAIEFGSLAVLGLLVALLMRQP